MKQAFLFFLLPAIGLWAHGDHGANFKHRVEAGPHVGWNLGGDIEEENLLWGFHADVHVNPHISVELGWTGFDDVFDPDRFGALNLPTDAEADLETRVWDLSAKWNFWGNDHLLNTYLGGGVSYYDWNVDSRRVDDRIDQLGTDVIDLDVEVDTDWGTHLLIGADVGITEHLEVFGEYRYQFMESQVNYTVVTRNADGQAVDRKIKDDFDYDYGQVRFGLNWRW